MRSCLALITFCLLLSACSNEKIKTAQNNDTEVSGNDIPPGTLIAADSIPILEDQLNKPYFSVRVFTTEHTDHYGVYNVDVAWGKNTAQSQLTMPKSDEKLIPVLRHIPGSYVYNIGFYYKDDTTFYDYYEVYAERGMIKMKYIKTYKFE